MISSEILKENFSGEQPLGKTSGAKAMGQDLLEIFGRPSEDFRRPLMPSLAASGGSWWIKKTCHGKLHPCSPITQKRFVANSNWVPLSLNVQINRHGSLGDETKDADIRQLQIHAPTLLTQHGRKHHIERQVTRTSSGGAMGCRYAKL